jgi:hypothetical protein
MLNIITVTYVQYIHNDDLQLSVILLSVILPNVILQIVILINVILTNVVVFRLCLCVGTQMLDPKNRRSFVGALTIGTMTLSKMPLSRIHGHFVYTAQMSVFMLFY